MRGLEKLARKRGGLTILKRLRGDLDSEGGEFKKNFRGEQKRSFAELGEIIVR